MKKNDQTIVKDDMVFRRYMPESGENQWQCIMHVCTGTVSVRLGGHGLIADHERPYEVWYPEDDAPTGYQTADDVWNYINSLNKKEANHE